MTRESGPATTEPAAAPVPPLSPATASCCQSKPFLVPIWFCWSWATNSMKNSSPTSSTSSLPNGEASSRSTRAFPVGPLNAATFARWAAVTFCPAAATSLARMRLIAARAAAAYGPINGVETPALKNAASSVIAIAVTVTQKATLIVSFEYCVCTAKLLACTAYARALLPTPEMPPLLPYSSRARPANVAVAGVAHPDTIVRTARPAGSADDIEPSDSAA
ncbi:hypothetical protein ACFMQL_39070 [Nonomuraea fastidiosa]|uniref:hypothetical protein n=1 Tax=Nonomuraea TaxID=83681 RepID=UPI00366E9CA2